MAAPPPRPTRVVSDSASRPARPSSGGSSSTLAKGPTETVVKQGQLLFLNKEQNEYVRCYTQLSTTTFSFLIHAGKLSRHLRPRVYLSAVRAVYAEVEDPPPRSRSGDGTVPSDELPDLHYQVILIEVATDVIVMRAVERESVKGWISAIGEALPELHIHHVSEIDGPQRGHFPPQFDALLFPRNHPGALKYSPVRRTHSRPTLEVAPRPVMAARSRMASVSAAAPQRGVVVRRPLPAEHVDPHHHAVEPTVEPIRAADAKPRKSVHVKLPPEATPAEEGASASASSSPSRAADERREALERQVAELTRENERLARELATEKNKACEMEIDATTASVRVLELESDIRMLKDGAAEWRRRYTSLEQQLQAQEDDFAARLKREKDEQLAVLTEDIEKHWSAMKREWQEREATLNDKINALQSELAVARGEQ